MIRIITALSLTLFLAFAARADRRPYLIDSLKAELAAVKTPADSLHLYQNILDLSAADSRARISVARQIFDVARNAGDTIAMIESLSYRATAAFKDTVELREIRRQLETVPMSLRRREAELFVDMFLVRAKLQDNEELSREELPHLMQESLSSEPMDNYKHVLLLYSACIALSNHTSGALLENYIERLIPLVESMNLPMGSVRNSVYNTAAMVFSGNRSSEKAVEMNKKLLNIVDSLSDNYARNGRIYRKLDRFRYLYYRRMLLNFHALSPGEIETYHREIHRLAKENSDIKADIESNPLVHACYLLSTGRYDQAMTTFKKAAEVKGNSYSLYSIYMNLFEAAQKSGNKTEQLEALIKLNQLLRDQLESKSEERYRELQIMYDVNDLKDRNEQMEEDRRQARLRISQILIVFSVAAICLLCAFLFIIWNRNKKMRKLGNELKSTADRLRKERNGLRSVQAELITARDQAKEAGRAKAEFIDNITHEIKTPLSAIAEYSRLIVDCIPDERQKYLNRFAEIIDLNTKLVLTLVDDMLDASSLEHGNMPVTVEGVSVQKLCNIAIGSVFENGKTANPGVKVIFNPSDKPDVEINTDRQRAGQILMNLLTNAGKFTERGKIIVDYTPDKEAHTITLSVTDTGCGIAAGREEEIFTRFNGNNDSKAGMGIGLYISRLLARLMGGNLTVDTSYEEGARFLLTLPMD